MDHTTEQPKEGIVERRRSSYGSQGRWRHREERPGRGRAWAIAWARRLAADPTTVYLDTETTGLDRRAEIVDIAVVGADGRVLFETLVRPLAPIPSDASAIHGIGDADVATAPTWAQIYAPLWHVLRDRPVVVYNASFDHRIVTQCCERHGLATPAPTWECAMCTYAEYQAAAYPGRARPPWRKLDDAVGAFGGVPGGHRAAADALACRHVVLGMASRDDPAW